MPCAYILRSEARGLRKLGSGAISVVTDWNLASACLEPSRAGAVVEQRINNKEFQTCPTSNCFGWSGAVVVLAGMPLLAASAQTQAPTPAISWRIAA